MGGKDVEAVIVSKRELELGGKVANCTGDDTEGNRGRCKGNEHAFQKSLKTERKNVHSRAPT